MSSNLKVNTILPSTGTTIGIGTIGGLINVVGNIDVNSTSGISTFNGLEISGIVTAKAGAAVTYYGDGSNLTGITDNVVTINNNANNRLITGSGSANTLEAESTLTYDGTNLDLGDSKKIRLGASQDLQLYHDGNDSYVSQTGTGNLILQGNASNNIAIRAKSGEEGINLIPNGAVELYYDNTKKFNTHYNGCQVQGRLGVGDDTAPETTFQVTATTAGAVYPMLLKNRTNGNAAVGMRFIASGADLSDGDFASIEAGHGAINTTNHEFRFKTCSGGTVAEKLRIQASGGISFNGDSAAANALDDYEEGSWTPIFTDDGTSGNSASSYTHQLGWYTKIGNIVNLQCRISGANTSGMNQSHAAYIKNLPFPIKGSSGRLLTGSALLSNCNIDSTTMGIGVLSNVGSSGGQDYSFFRIFQTKDNTPWVSIKVSQFPSGNHEILINLTYRAA